MKSKPLLISRLFALSCAAFVAGCGGGGSGSSGSTTTAPSSSPAPTLSMSAAIDRDVGNRMSASGATAASVAVMKNGQLVYAKTYGWQDAAKTVPLRSDALFRTMSIVKPVTAAAVRKLAADGDFSLSDHVFCTGSNAPCRLPASLLPANVDPLASQITIQNLIDHRGGWAGWNRGVDVNGDPIAIEPMIRDKLGLSGPPARSDIVRYIMGFPLDFAPGTGYAYSNFGYMLLGMIVEQASGTSYTQYVQNAIMAPLGVAGDFQAANSLPANHDAREPVYNSTWSTDSVFTKGKIAPFAEEGFEAANWRSVGLSLATPQAMSKFASAYKLPTGEPLAGKTNTGAHSGGLDGSATYLKQLADGTSYAVFFNIAFDDAGYQAIQTQLDVDVTLPAN